MGYRELIQTPLNSGKTKSRSFLCTHQLVDRILPRRQVAVFKGNCKPQTQAKNAVEKIETNFSDIDRTTSSKEDKSSFQTSTKITVELMRGTTGVCDEEESKYRYRHAAKKSLNVSRKSTSNPVTRSLKPENFRGQALPISSPTTHRQALRSDNHRGKSLPTIRSAPAATRSSWRTQLPQLFALYEQQLCPSYRPSAKPPPVPEPVVTLVQDSSSGSRRMRRYSTGRRMSVASTATCSAFDQSIRPHHSHGKPRQRAKGNRRLSLAEGKKDFDQGSMGTWAVRRFLRRSLPDEILEDHEAQDETILNKLPFVTTLPDFPRSSKKLARRNSITLKDIGTEVKLAKGISDHD
ncbi:uncharacterized protein [Branchiostoma lanceolatum]|uniref:uncharacterized protein n=1 Tax=Branchiostoma lanceolatum TaxID=7740 RepID=UPI00345142B6